MLEKQKQTTEEEDKASDEDHIWVFGYGSLIWKPNFQYVSSAVGYIEGFTRYFWQLSTVHRGNPEKPGRVVTMVKNSQEKLWGIVYKVQTADASRALSYLNNRECVLGGYEVDVFQVHLQDHPGTTVSAVVYRATPCNELYSETVHADNIVAQIVRSRGVSGPNVEYLFRLADFMRAEVPHYHEKHLFELDYKARVMIGLSTENIASWQEVEANNVRLAKVHAQHQPVHVQHETASAGNAQMLGM